MVNYKARLITIGGKPIGLYHYTAKHGKNIYPVGRCAQNCPGHQTEEEAQEHYREYLLEERYSEVELGRHEKCLKCPVFTVMSVQIDGRIYPLCGDHRKKEIVSKLLKVGESWES